LFNEYKSAGFKEQSIGRKENQNDKNGTPCVKASLNIYWKNEEAVLKKRI